MDSTSSSAWVKFRRPRMSLRLAMMLIALMGASLAIVSCRATRQEQAVRWIHQHGGAVHYAHERRDDGSWNSQSPPPVPAWITQIVSPHYIYRVDEVLLSELPARDDAALLSRLYDVRRISVNRARVSTFHIEQICKLRRLEELALGKCRIDEDALNRLPDSQTLRQLGLTHDRLSAQAIKSVLAMPRLRFVSLSGSDIRLSPGDSWSAMQDLEELHLDDVQVPEQMDFDAMELPPQLRVLIVDHDTSNPSLNTWAKRASEQSSLKVLRFPPAKQRWDWDLGQWRDLSR